MRTKKISLLLALVLVISAIALPLTAYAAGDKIPHRQNLRLLWTAIP